MSADKNVTITITAKNLTSEGFAEARRALVGLGTETDRLGSRSKDAFAGMTAGLKEFAGALGIGLSIGAVVGFGRSIVEAAGHVGDLASTLDISIENVQRFKYAAEQGGATMDDVGTSIAFMNKSLGEGSSGTRAALRSIGLDFATIRSLRPDEAFLAIADGLKAIPDPATRARVTVELFGRTGQNLLPSIRDGIREVGAETIAMSDITVIRLKHAADTWKSYWARVTVYAAEASGPAFNALVKLASAGLGSAGIAGAAAKAAADAAAKARTEWDALAHSAVASHGPVVNLLADFRKAQAEVRALTPATRAQVDAGLALGKTIEQLADQYHFSSDAAKVYQDVTTTMREEQKKVSESHKKAAEEAAKHATAVAALALDVRSFPTDSPLVKMVVSMKASGRSVGEIAEGLGVIPTVIELIVHRQEAMNAALKAGEQRAAGFAEQYRQFLDDQNREMQRSMSETVQQTVQNAKVRAEADADVRAALVGQGKLRRDNFAEESDQIHAKAKAYRDQLNPTAYGYAEALKAVDRAEAAALSTARAHAFKQSLQDDLRALQNLTRGLSSAGDLIDSHILKGAGRWLEKMQQIAGTIHDLTSGLSRIQQMVHDVASLFRKGEDRGSGPGGGLQIPGMGGGDGEGGGFSWKRMFGGGGGGGGGLLPGGSSAHLAAPGAADSAAGAAGGGGGGKSGIKGFLTNPWTIGIGAAIGGGLLLRHFLKADGSEIKKKFGAQFGGLDVMRDLLHKKLGDAEGEGLWQEMGRVGKRDEKAARRWEDHVIEGLGRVGMTNLRKFETGTGPHGVPFTMAAIVHQGETITPAGQAASVVNNYYTTINATDADSIRRLMRGAGGPAFIEWIRSSGAARTALNAATGNG